MACRGQKFWFIPFQTCIHTKQALHCAVTLQVFPNIAEMVGCPKKTKVVLIISAPILSRYRTKGELPKKFETNQSILRGPTSQLKYLLKI